MTEEQIQETVDEAPVLPPDLAVDATETEPIEYEPLLLDDEEDVVEVEAAAEEDFADVLADTQVNPELFEEGKWFKCRAFGDNAKLKIAGIGCERWVDLNRKAMKKLGDRKTGRIPPEKTKMLVPQMYAQAILVDFADIDLVQAAERLNRHRFRVPVDADGVPTGTIERREKGKNGVWSWVAYSVKLEGGKPSATLAGRQQLLAAFQPEGPDAVHRIASRRKGYDDEFEEAEVRGN